MEKILTAAIFLLLAIAFHARQGHCEAQTPEQLVRDFYAWYFEADKGPVAAEDKPEIYKYVAAKAVKYIKYFPPENVSYFVKANTFNAIWEKPKIIVGKSVLMAGDMYIIPVTFKLRDENYHEDYHVVVFAMKENGSFYIIKVTDIYPYS